MPANSRWDLIQDFKGYVYYRRQQEPKQQDGISNSSIVRLHRYWSLWLFLRRFHIQ